MMTYPEIRERVRDADIAFFSGDTFLSRAIKRVTKSPISHIGLLFWDGELLMLHEAVDEGCRAIRMSAKVAKATNPVIIARHREIDSVPKRSAIRRESNYLLAVEYNFWALAQIYFRIRLGIGRKPRFDKELICSEYVAKAYGKAGIKFTSIQPRIGFLSPQDIYADPMLYEIGRVEPQVELERIEI